MRQGRGGGPSQRQLRVGEQVRHALSQVFQREDIRDDRLQGAVVSVSEVRMSPDLKVATCYVAPIGAVDGEIVVKALNEHARFLRGRVGPALRQMRYMPELRFRLDTSFDNFYKIDAILHSPEVARDLPNPPEEGDVDGQDGDVDGGDA